MFRRSLCVLALAVLTAAAGCASPHARATGSAASSVPGGASKAVAGGPAPKFSVLTTQGPFDLDAVKRPVFVEVFATWCPHCQHETGAINALYKRYAGRVAFVAVSGSATGMDGRSPETQADVLAFAQRFGVRYPLAYDPTLEVANRYLQGGFPTIAILNRRHVITYLYAGEVSERALAAQLRKALR